MRFTQQNRQIAISTPLGADALLLRAFRGEEALSHLFSFDLDLLSENDSISFDQMVGQRVDIRIDLADGTPRVWNGHVSRFAQLGRDENLCGYHATVVPWLWFLTRTADCRIFQNKKAPDIIQQIFKDLGFSDYALRLYGDFVTRDYCVQYRETDFNFVSRLMEEEGIFYFFEHQAGKHTLVLANDPAAHKPCPEQAAARYEGTAGGWQDDDVVLDWRQEQEYRPGAFSYTDYNFETPASSLMATVNGNGKYEIYDFPGEYRKRNEGDGLVRIRLQEQEMPRVVARGSSDCRAFTTGYRFDLKEHYRGDLNQSYVLTAIRHEGTQNVDFVSGASALDGPEPRYRNSFECIPHSTPFRPARTTPVPVVKGCQSAVVVGPGGEEIYTDQYGRVKVQFHWDREGKRNENSSCWIRVSHPWAGKGWGSVSIPRIGQEVLVDFLEGDPDQPIIIGRVYNAGQMPPFGLPGKGMVSGVKSNSTKGGGGNNEFSLDDTKGNELINVHGQFDMQTKIEHDERVDIGNDRTEKVGHNETIHIVNDRTETVDANETITVHGKRTETVDGNENITIHSNRKERVDSNEDISIGGNRTEAVSGNETITVSQNRTRGVIINESINVGAAQEIVVGGLQSLQVGITRSVHVGTSQKVDIGTSLTEKVGTEHKEDIGTDRTVKIGANLKENVGADKTVEVTGKLNQKIGGDRTEEDSANRKTKVGSDDTLDVGSNLTIKAGSQITLETGQSKIVMKSGGDIEISGMSIKITGSTSVKAEAVSINIEASGVNTVKGSLVKIN